MDTTKKALQEIAFQLNALNTTVAAIEAHLETLGFKANRVTELKELAQQAEGVKMAAGRLQALIAELPQPQKT